MKGWLRGFEITSLPITTGKYTWISLQLDACYLDIAQSVKNLSAVQETLVRFLDREDPWRRKWQLTPVFLSKISHGQRTLLDYSPKGHKESDMTEETEHVRM